MRLIVKELLSRTLPSAIAELDRGDVFAQPVDDKFAFHDYRPLPGAVAGEPVRRGFKGPRADAGHMAVAFDAGEPRWRDGQPRATNRGCGLGDNTPSDIKVAATNAMAARRTIEAIISRPAG